MANQLRRIDPFGELSRFEPFHLMDDMLREWGMRPGGQDQRPGQHIRMDVAETDDAYRVRAEIPGVNKEDIHVDVEGSRVSISAECRQDDQQGQGRSLRTERFYGQVSRVFTLDQDIDDDRVTASYHDGILELELPKRAGGMRKQISVN